MSVVPVIVDGLPTLTLAAGSAGGVAVASTIDPANDYLPIYTASLTATQGINRNTLLGLSSAPVGLTDTQVLTNKTLTNPTINGAALSGTLSGTYTLGGTPTFPSSVATLTGSQTLTNKVLTSPTINAPTITNATYSGDAIVGYTTSNSGTVYGLAISGGTIGTGGITNSSLAANSVTPDKRSGGFAVGTIPAATFNTTGNHSVTSLGFTPKVVRFTVMPTSATTGLVSGGGIAISASNQYWWYTSSTTSSFARESGSGNCIIMRTSGTTTALVTATFVSQDSGGFTFNVSTANSVFDVLYEAYA